MKELKQLLNRSLVTLLLGLGCLSVRAQDGPPDFANLTPEQIQQRLQQRLMDNIRDQLAVTNDAEWNALEPLVAKIVEDKLESLAAGAAEMRRLLGNGSDDAGPGWLDFGPPDAAAEILQNTLDANAPRDQIKAALVRYQDSRKRQEAETAANRERLRQVLTVRQEAVLVLMGLLD